ncbi:MAG: hypothetical protein KatS3mg105_5271 [Gemmatales bacterium]|nr:MAG: hypothetical protein KatS3mg105_5271 [Gemmatales bacterium]
MSNRLLYDLALRILGRDRLLAVADLPLRGLAGLRRYLGERSLEAFARLYFRELTDPPAFHQEAYRQLDEIAEASRQNRRGSKIAVFWPRGHSKTTIFSKVLPLAAALQDWSKLTVLLANNQTAAERLLANIREELETNPYLLEDYGNQRGPVWSSQRIELANGSIITAFGRGSGALRGVQRKQRPRLVIADDIEDDQSVRSATETEAARQWWQKAVLGVGDNVGFTTSFVYVGTLLSQDSLATTILNSPDFTVSLRRAIEREPDRIDLWEEWRKTTIDLAGQGKAPASPEVDEFYQRHKEELERGAVLLWPRPDALWHLMRYRLAAGEAAFATEFQNDPTGAGYQPLGPIPILPALPEGNYYRLAAFDPTVSGKTSADYPAFVEVCYYPDRDIAVVDYVLAEKADYRSTIVTVANRVCQHKTPLDALIVEANGAFTAIADALQAELYKLGRTEIVTKLVSSGPKAQRIQKIGLLAGAGKLFVVQPVHRELQREWQSWPVAKNDDVVDAISMIIELLQKQHCLRL